MKDTRFKCPFCGMRTWSQDWKGFMLDHDRSDGRHCRKARKSAIDAANLEHTTDALERMADADAELVYINGDES